MNVFISWAGPRSGAMATALSDWIPLLLESAKPWLSKADIPSGRLWRSELAESLSACKFGIFCLTRESLKSSWMFFEAGAVSKTLLDAYVCPLLLDMQFSDVPSPFADFQCRMADQEGVFELMRTLNNALPAEIKSDEKFFERRFVALWPNLLKALQALPPESSEGARYRSQAEILEEVLGRVRSLEQGVSRAIDPKSSDAVQLLASGIAHDFNNLLVGIMGGASIAVDSLEKDHPAYPMLELIMRSSERGAVLTQQLSAFAGKLNITIGPANLARVVRDACSLIRATVPENVRLSVEIPSDMPTVNTSSAHIQQVIVNLITNSIEAIGTEDGNIKVSTTVHKSVPESIAANMLSYDLPLGPCICVEVSDSGMGMDMDTMRKIFDPFFTTKFAGRGLGLAAVRGTMRSLGGAIQVESVVGVGTKFKVFFTIADEAVKKVAAESKT